MVLELVKRIPSGRVTSYGEIALALGNKGLSRAVGIALKRNLNPGRIPCHRVVNSDSTLGGYSRGMERKIELLELEGIRVKSNRIQNFNQVFFRFMDRD